MTRRHVGPSSFEDLCGLHIRAGSADHRELSTQVRHWLKSLHSKRWILVSVTSFYRSVKERSVKWEATSKKKVHCLGGDVQAAMPS